MVNYNKLVYEFLINSFVEDYAYNKKFVEKFNNELENLGITYKYTYDEFCVELLDRTLYILDEVRDSLSVKKLKLAFHDIIDRIVDEMKACKVRGDMTYSISLKDRIAQIDYKRIETVE